MADAATASSFASSSESNDTTLPSQQQQQQQAPWANAQQDPPTYRLKPLENEKFNPAAARLMAEKVLLEELKGKAYDEAKAKEWAAVIAERTKQAVKALNIPRYKVVVQVTLGEMRDQGIRVASRCLWDAGTDNHASASFKNESLWCSAMIFAVYME